MKYQWVYEMYYKVKLKNESLGLNDGMEMFTPVKIKHNILLIGDSSCGNCGKIWARTLKHDYFLDNEH